jgi:hypothetical protein
VGLILSVDSKVTNTSSFHVEKKPSNYEVCILYPSHKSVTRAVLQCFSAKDAFIVIENSSNILLKVLLNHQKTMGSNSACPERIRSLYWLNHHNLY